VENGSISSSSSSLIFKEEIISSGVEYSGRLVNCSIREEYFE
jgi:hypothetical protein